MGLPFAISLNFFKPSRPDSSNSEASDLRFCKSPPTRTPLLMMISGLVEDFVAVAEERWQLSVGDILRYGRKVIRLDTLMDIGFIGPPFAWSNGQILESCIVCIDVHGQIDSP
ncbi:hypothetical protein Nepgr_015374 [Nepenthes gracilis]|uniref:Uncharacterized protein n=1 Tax=Nepenthes gracilis TaxID=150966 RepID=A0AAD3SKZ8_NEPGR|nr:hypothetical protein Nepgr_015374 [Nepenthes gracilis]